MDIPPRGRGRSTSRARSRSRQWQPARIFNTRPAEPPADQQQQYEQPRRPRFEKQKTEAREAIRNYEEKKKDPSHKDITLQEFFTEWIETERKNMSGTLNDFEKDAIKKYLDFLLNSVDVKRITKQDKREVQDSTEAGLTLAVALRLLRTSSQTQKQMDNEFYRLTEEIEKMEVPSFYNTILSNIGKFSDETFGNFRIEYPLTRAKQKTLESILKIEAHVSDDLAFDRDKSREQFDQWITSIKHVDNNLFIFNEKDTTQYLKYHGRKEFDKYRDKSYKIISNNKEIYLSFPQVKFPKITKQYVGTYLKMIEFMDSDISPEVKKDRDGIIACLLFQLSNLDFVENPDYTIKEWMPYFKSSEFDFFNEIKIRDLYAYTNLTYTGDYLDNTALKHNAKVVYNYYMQTSYPWLKRNFNMTELTNSNFGSLAQLIEVKDDDPRYWAANRRDFSAITKFKDKNLNVFGAVFNFLGKLEYKRKISSTLNSTTDNIISSFVQKDIKFKKT